MKRVFLFIVTNLGILAVLSISMQVLGVDRMLQQNGMNLTGLLIMAAIMGMGGAFISLLLSKWMAKQAVGAQVIDRPSDNLEAWLLDTVRQQAQAAGYEPSAAAHPLSDVSSRHSDSARDLVMPAANPS